MCKLGRVCWGQLRTVLILVEWLWRDSCIVTVVEKLSMKMNSFFKLYVQSKVISQCHLDTFFFFCEPNLTSAVNIPRAERFVSCLWLCVGE